MFYSVAPTSAFIDPITSQPLISPPSTFSLISDRHGNFRPAYVCLMKLRGLSSQQAELKSDDPIASKADAAAAIHFASTDNQKGKEYAPLEERTNVANSIET